MANFVVDTFSGESSLVDLTAHTGETGATWTTITGHNSAKVSNNYNDAYAGNFGGNGNIASGTPTSADYTVSATVKFENGGIGDYPGIVGRCSNSAFTCYMLRYNHASLRWELYYVNAGALNLLGSWSETLTDSDSRSIILDLSGATITGKIAGTTRIQQTDSNISAAGYAGVRLYKSNSYYGRVDDFVASAAAGSTYQLTADGGSYAVSGADAGLLRSARLGASGGSLSISGTAASLLSSRLIDASSGSFLLTGADAELRSNRYMLADNGAFALTGSDAALLRNSLISAGAGSFALTGSDATLTYTPSGAYILTCEAGSFALSGSGVDLLRDYIMPVDPGSYALSGADAGLLLSRMLAASGGTFTLTGADADFLRDYNLVCDGGTYTITGQNVTLTYSGFVLPSGKMSISFSVKIPGINFSVKSPAITFTIN